MKEKILPFIIGLLLGAILATGGFLIYSKSVGSNNQNIPQMNDGMGNPPVAKIAPNNKPIIKGNIFSFILSSSYHNYII